jgi:hypothetical protein
VSYGLEPRAKISWKKVREICRHIAGGLSHKAALGEAEVSHQTWTGWLEKYPTIYEEVGIAKMKRLAYLEKGLLKEDAKMPQVVSRIFALKNADHELWQENPGKNPAIDGLHQNIVVVTGVPEALPDPQNLPKTIEHQPNDTEHSVIEPD